MNPAFNADPNCRQVLLEGLRTHLSFVPFDAARDNVVAEKELGVVTRGRLSSKEEHVLGMFVSKTNHTTRRSLPDGVS